MTDQPQPGTVEFFEAAEVPTVVVRRADYPMSEMPALFDSTFSALFPALAEAGLQPAGPAFSLHTRMPTDTIDIELGVPVSAPLAAPITRADVELVPSCQPAGSAARTAYLGGYEGLGNAWGGFMGAIAATGRRQAFPFWEVYVTQPTPETDPATLRTDLITLVTGDAETD
jgi:effector-binding domain-containing protein